MDQSYSIQFRALVITSTTLFATIFLILGYLLVMRVIRNSQKKQILKRLDELERTIRRQAREERGDTLQKAEIGFREPHDEVRVVNVDKESIFGMEDKMYEIELDGPTDADIIIERTRTVQLERPVKGNSDWRSGGRTLMYPMTR